MRKENYLKVSHKNSTLNNSVTFPKNKLKKLKTKVKKEIKQKFIKNSNLGKFEVSEAIPKNDMLILHKIFLIVI